MKKDAEQTRFTGKVKWFNEEKGMGYITPTNGGPDVHFHVTNIFDTVKHYAKKQTVYYTLGADGSGRITAKSVRAYGEILEVRPRARPASTPRPRIVPMVVDRSSSASQ